MLTDGLAISDVEIIDMIRAALRNHNGPGSRHHEGVDLENA
jgi:hypothetical protein